MNPCDQCPWRLANHGKPHPGSFYTKRNLRRLWNEVRGGGQAQSCHLTDPSHPDHIKFAGTKEGATARECPGSVVLIKREFRKMATPEGVIDQAGIDRYLAERPKGARGITKRGLLYWAVMRVALAGKPFVGGPPLPEVNEDDPAIGLPAGWV